MRRQSVKSSSIAAIGYDETNEVLEIEFLSGGIYQNLDVPYYAFDEFKLIEKEINEI